MELLADNVIFPSSLGRLSMAISAEVLVSAGIGIGSNVHIGF